MVPNTTIPWDILSMQKDAVKYVLRNIMCDFPLTSTKRALSLGVGEGVQMDGLGLNGKPRGLETPYYIR